MKYLKILNNKNKIAGGLALFASASLWLFIFKSQNFYNSEFYTNGGRLIFYQIQKIVFIPLILVSFFYTGKIIIKDNSISFQCMSGACLQFIILFLLGSLGTLKPFFIYILFLTPLLFFRYDHLQSFIRSIFKMLRKNTLTKIQISFLCLVIIFLYLAKGAFPWGGHDFFTHYFPAYKFVVQNQSIWPNDCWYHIFYGNWNLPAFYSMILLDNSCANFLTFILVCLAAFCLQNCNEEPEKMTLAATLFLGIYIFTPGSGIYKAHGGWGDFEKLHEVTGAFLLFYFLSLYEMFKRKTDSSKNLSPTVAVLLSSSLLILVNYNIGIVLFLATAIFGALSLLFIRKTFQVLGKILLFQGMLILAKSLLLMVMIGLPSDKFLRILWPFISDNFISSQALYTVLLKLFYYLAPSPPDTDFKPLEFFLSITHSKYTIAIFGFCVLNILLFKKYLKHSIWCPPNQLLTPHNYAALNILIFIAVFYVLLWQSRQFYISGFRFSSVLVGLYIFLIFHYFWNITFITKKSKKILKPFSISCMTALVLILLISSWVDPNFKTYFLSRVSFFSGKTSFYEAYRNPNGQSGRLNFGAMHPGAEKAVDLLPPNSPIWSFHIHTYCMKPSANIQMDFSFIGPGNYLDCVFGKAEIAELGLKKRNINYFLISKTLPTSDLLIFSPIFDPGTLTRKFKIIHEDDDNFLLSWQTQKITENSSIKAAIYERLKNLILQSRATNNFFLKEMLFAKYLELHKSN